MILIVFDCLDREKEKEIEGRPMLYMEAAFAPEETWNKPNI